MTTTVEVKEALRRVGREDDSRIDLAEAALMLAAFDCPGAPVNTYRDHLGRLAAETAEAALAVRVSELSEALGEVKQLRGLLSICAYCKRIREGEHFTRSVEAYLTEHTDATFSHGVCPECYEKHVRPQVENL